MRVKDAMKKTVRTISPDRSLSEAATVMNEFGIGHLVVVERRVPVGVLSDGDILRHGSRGTVASAMSKRLVTVDSEEPVRRAANMMRGHDIKSLVVTSGDRLAGIITSTDILEIVSRSGHRERMTLRDRGARKSSPRA
jgi:CBS domain-containing protein